MKHPVLSYCHSLLTRCEFSVWSGHVRKKIGRETHSGRITENEMLSSPSSSVCKYSITKLGQLSPVAPLNRQLGMQRGVKGGG